MGEWARLLPRLSTADRKWVERDLAAAEKRVRKLIRTSPTRTSPTRTSPTNGSLVSLDAVPNGSGRAYALALHRMVCRGDLLALELPELPELPALAERKALWRFADLLWCLETAARGAQRADAVAHLQLPVAIAAQLDPHLLSAVRPAFEALFTEVVNDFQLYTDERRRLLVSLGRVLDNRANGLPWWLLHNGDEFGPASRADLGDVFAAAGVPELFVHCASLDKPVPAKAWLRKAESLLAPASPAGTATPAAAGPDGTATPAAAGPDGTATLAAAGSGGTGRQAAIVMLERFAGYTEPVHEDTDRLLRGLAWVVAGDAGEATTDLLARVASAAAKAPASALGYPTAPRTAAATVEILTGREGDAAVRMLARLSIVVRNKALNSRVQKALDRLGALRGWVPGEALELAVNDHGLDADGRLIEKLGAYEAIVEIADERARLRFGHDGRLLKSVPQAVKLGHGERLGELRHLVKDVGATLAAERQRVEGLFSSERVWAYPEWVCRYLNQPITASYARRLLWQTTMDGREWTTGLPRHSADGWVLVGIDGHAARGQQIRLWHPARAEVEEVMRWRDHIISCDLRQPFKQAFREVYLLTPAELSTRTYSNRFAGHILQYRQANALMRVRGWQASYLGGWDGGYESEAVKQLAGGTWRASFYHEFVENQDGNDYTARYCATDQVRFDRRDGAVWQATPLQEVPPLVFSEAMRDVDLFVGVTSIAVNPQWNDRGEDRFHEYWQTAAFGELTPSASVRRDALARLLPRMRIAERRELSRRFLRVRGNLRAYKIHVGSANILMEPNDEYLCIVPDRKHAGSPHLPFDEDPVLPMILSKALLLAADDKIADPSIVRQITRAK